MNKLINANLLLLFLMFFAFSVRGQNQDLIQFSGIVVSGDDLKPVPYTNIIIKNTYRGTVSDFYGFFSFVAKESDTLEFSCLGFKTSEYIVPDTLHSNKYSLIQILRTDTFLLKETVIRPWPTQEQFHEAFIRLNIPDDDLERAKRNLARAEMKERMEQSGMDGSMNYKYAMQQKQSQLYYVGQYAPNNLLNPIAWAQFIQAWQRGDFKKKKTTEED